MPALLIPLLLAAAEAPITVVAHPWAPFISPMGEPFRAHNVNDDTLANWFGQADRDHDGGLTPAEMQADADRFFATLDEDHDGELDPDEIAHYEYEVAPDVQVMSRLKRAASEPRSVVSRDGLDGEPQSRRAREQRRQEEVTQLGIGGTLQGAARYALLNIPEPVAAADADFNRGVSVAEFRRAALARFELLDRQRSGRLTLAQLQSIRAANWAIVKKPRRKKGSPDERVGNALPADRHQMARNP